MLPHSIFSVAFGPNLPPMMPRAGGEKRTSCATAGLRLSISTVRREGSSSASPAHPKRSDGRFSRQFCSRAHVPGGEVRLSPERPVEPKERENDARRPRRAHTKTWTSETGRTLRKAKKNYSDRTNAILGSLKEVPESEIEAGLERWKGELQPRELSVVLNEERSWSRALRIFSWARRQEGYAPNVFHYNIVLKVLARAGEFELVDRIWGEMADQGVAPTNVSYSTLIDACGRAGQPRRAMRWFEELKGRGFEPDVVTMNTLVNLHRRCGDVAAAEQALRTFSWDVETCNSMIDLYGRVGRFADASELFSSMMAAGIRPDAVTFNTMIRVCGLAGRVEEAEGVYSRMEANGLSPDVATFNALISLFVDAGEVEKALEYFSRMRGAGIEADQVSFHALLGALAVRDMVGEAEVLAREMDELGVKTGEAAGVGLARMFIRLGLVDRARQVLAGFGSDGCLGSASLAAVVDAYGEKRLWAEAEDLFLRCRQSWSVENFNTMIKAYGIAGLHDKAWELFGSMEGRGVTPDEITFVTVIHALARRCPAPTERVENLRTQMRERGYALRGRTFNALMGMYGRLGKVREARQTFEEMEAAGVSPDEVAHGALINAFAEAGRVEEAERAASSMKRAGFALNKYVFTTLMKMYGLVGDLEGVERMYREMGRAGARPDTFATNCLIHQYGRAGKVKDAERVFAQLLADGPGANANEVTFTLMLDMYRELGLIREALGMAKRMLGGDDNLRDVTAYNSILELYASLGIVGEAINVFHVMNRRAVDPDMVTYSIMAGTLKRAGLLREALDVFSVASRSGLSLTCESLTTLTSLYAHAGLVKESLQACEKLRHGGFVLDNAAFNAMMYAYGSAGRFDESLRLFMEMQTRGPQPDVITYTTVITIYGKSGLLEGVSRIFKRMKQAGCEPTMATYRVVIDIYRNAGQLDLASVVEQQMQFARYLKEERIPQGSSERREDW